MKEFFDQAVTSSFPLRYRFDEKNYIIKYDAFNYTRAKYYSAMGEWAYKKNDFTGLLDYSRSSIVLLSDGFLKLLVNDYLLIAKSRLSQYDREMTDYSLNYITTYLNLDKVDKDYFDSVNYSYTRGWKYLEEALTKAPSSAENGQFMLHGSYMKVQRNMYAWTDMFFKEVDDNSDEDYRWSGQQIDLAFRFSPEKFRKRDVAAYIGPQIGYSTRKLMPVTSDVTNNTTGVTDYAVELEPLDTYYQLGLNMGQFISGKAIGMDYHFSIGAAYGKFSMDHPQCNLNDYTYSHSFLDQREEWHWGLVMRVGVTIGLSL